VAPPRFDATRTCLTGARLALLLAGLAVLPASAQELAAQASCRFTGTDFVYDCSLGLTRGGQPLADAEFTISADMPSMPMMHATVAVQARPGSRRGEYLAQLDLDMTGEWRLTLDFSRPARARLLLDYEFDERGAHPVAKRGSSAK
jgi:hypothetical protein